MLLASPTPLVDISYRPDLHIVVVRWLGVTTDEETRRVYRQLGALPEPLCRFWLLDARRRPSSSPAVTNWIFDVLAPQLAQRLGGPIYLSYLISPSHLAAAESFQQESNAAGGLRLPYRLNYASQEGDATEWLLQAQQTEAAGAAQSVADPLPAIS
ncbi:hypothetical protein D3Y59_09590 [Hymenobacter oligotrophus]|uniref:STAS/SEC14 domain-containing protein n=1 Tax=Hymenobacter oligotrophus TaxID=2319843 RepID=A0A3B7R0K5_9BACT|nr:hypothetical protein [Hymenobacter oligotrophus]AYA37282.1 hypothetical protein D3Y59_09590 [Hymenobacter oligotrophus]